MNVLLVGSVGLMSNVETWAGDNLACCPDYPARHILHLTLSKVLDVGLGRED